MHSLRPAILLSRVRFVVIGLLLVARPLRSAESPGRLPICSSPFWAEIADLDDDGIDDVLTVGGRPNFLEIGRALSDGAGGFKDCTIHREGMPLQLDWKPDGVVFGDFTGDGLPDIVGLDGSGNPPELGDPGSNRILLFRNQGTSFNWTVAVPDIQRRSGHAALAAADMDADGNLDIVFGTGRGSDGYIQVWGGNGDGTFYYLAELVLPFEDDPPFHPLPQDIELADFDDDGQTDIAVLLSGGADIGEVRVFLSTGRGDNDLGLETVWEDKFGNTGAASGLVSLGLTSPDRLDLVVFAVRPLDGRQQMLLYRSRPGGGFASEPDRLPVIMGISASLVADFDEDGRDDLLVNGQVVFQILLSSESYQTDRPNLYFYQPVSAAHTGFRASDFDGDGLLDLVVSDTKLFGEGEASLLVIHGLGDGRFDARSAVEGECGQYGGAGFGDFNEDGTIDVVAFKNYSSDPFDLSLGPCILLGRPGATASPFFEPGDVYGDDGAGESVGPVVADFDSDGHLDVIYGVRSTVTAPERQPALGIRRGRGDGTFATFHPILESASPHPGAKGPFDFNEDGLADIFNGTTLIGRGDGGFDAGWSLIGHPLFADRCCENWPSGMKLVEVLDCNNDGLVDQVYVDTYSDSLRFWFMLNKADGSFAPRDFPIIDTFRAGLQGGGAAADFTGDGHIDLAMPWSDPADETRRSHRILVFPGTPPLGFSERPIEIVVEDGRLYLYPKLRAVDLNDDGQFDIVSTFVERRIAEGNRPSTTEVLYSLGGGVFSSPVRLQRGLRSWRYFHDMNADGQLDLIVSGGGFLARGLEVVLLDPEFGGVFLLRGDCNTDGGFNISDPLYLLQYLFSGGAEPACLAACSVRPGADSSVQISDAITMLNTLFGGGAVTDGIIILPRCDALPSTAICRSPPECVE